MSKTLKVAFISLLISLAFNFIAVKAQATENISGVDISKWKTYKSIYGIEFKYPKDKISVDSDFADSKSQYYRLLSVLIENKHKQGINGQTSIIGSLEVDDTGLGSKDSFIADKKFISNSVKWECGPYINWFNSEKPAKLFCMSEIDNKYYKFTYDNLEEDIIINQDITESMFYSIVGSFNVSEPTPIFGRMDFLAFGFLNYFIFDSEGIMFVLISLMVFVGISKIVNLFWSKWISRQNDGVVYAYRGYFLVDSVIVFVTSFAIWVFLSTIAEIILGEALYMNLEPFSSVGLAILGTFASSLLVRKIWRKNDMSLVYFELISIFIFATLMFLFISYSLSNLHGIGA